MRQDIAFLAFAEEVLRGFRPLYVDIASHRARLLAGVGLELCTTRWPPFSPEKISILWICFATLRRLPECAGLYTLGHMLMALRGPQVADLRLVRFVVAAMDHLLRSVLELKHQVTHCRGAGFDDFLLHDYSPILPTVFHRFAFLPAHW